MSKKLDFTNDQQNAINADCSLLVSAAAGSGKTAVLTERVVRLLTGDKQNAPLSIDKLLIVTFTNAAAVEMRTRIARRLDEMIADNPYDSHLKSQRLMLPGAKICTIDSFCIELVRNNFSVLGIEPQFSVAESSSAELLFRKSFDAVLKKYYASSSEDFDLLADFFSLRQSETVFYKTVKKLYEKAICTDDPEKWLKSSAARHRFDGSAPDEFLSEIMKDLSSRLKNFSSALGTFLNDAQNTGIYSSFKEKNGYLASLSKNLILSIENGDVASFLDGIQHFSFGSVRCAPKTDPDGTALYNDFQNSTENDRDYIKNVKGHLCDFESYKRRSDIQFRIISLLGNIVWEVYFVFFENMKIKNTFTFSAIEQMALKILTEFKDGEFIPSAKALEIADEYEEVLVDEYQDNNDMQDLIFRSISGNKARLFMVGDVKQSIYGFRNSNPDNFLKYKENFPLFQCGAAESSKVVLKSNFRSRKGICDFVNAFCGSLMSKETCNMDYTDEDSLSAEGRFTDIFDTLVEINFNRLAESSISKEEADAKSVADYIEKVIKEGYKVSDFADKSEDNVPSLRNAEYRDITVLMRSPRTKAAVYCEEFKKRNIPYSYGDDDFYTSNEILLAVSFVKVINNPSLDIPLLSVMLSPVFGFTPDDVANLKRKYPANNLYASLLAAENTDEKCRYTVKTLANLRSVSVSSTVSDVLRNIYKVTNICELMSVLPDGERRNAKLKRLLTVASKYGPALSGGIQRFLNDVAEAAVKDDEVKLNINSDNSVKIMSFHGSKGLQFPITILAGCHGNFNMNDQREKILVFDQVGFTCKYFENGDTFNCPSVFVLKKKANRKLIAEEMRLFYVAMTRAVDRLFITSTLKDVEGRAKKLYENIFGNMTDGCKLPSETVLSSKSFSDFLLLTVLLRKNAENLRENAEIPIKEVLCDTDFSLKITSVELSQVKENVLESEITLKEESNDSPLTPDEEKMKKELTARFDFTYPYLNETTVKSKMAVTELIKGNEDDHAFSARPEFLWSKGLNAAEKGTAAHKFMQLADYENAAQDTENELLRLKENEFLSEAEADCIDVESISRFFESEIYRRMLSAVNVRREYKFMIKMPLSGTEIIAQGIADCVIEEKDGLIILDFKTDNVTDVNVLKERYSEQLRIYSEALSRILEKNVKERILYSLKTGEYVTV